MSPCFWASQLTVSGFGLGICHELLRNLSVDSGVPVPSAVPQLAALPSPLSGLLDGPGAAAASTAASLPRPHPTFTLVLACRSEKNAIAARDAVLARHKKDLAARRRKGIPVPYGWEEGLRVEYELVDLDSVGGDKGLLSFARRIGDKYPHVTSLFLNAGYAAFKQVVMGRFMMQVLTNGLIHALHRPRYNIENVGERSADGERGSVWGVNVLAPYILVSGSRSPDDTLSLTPFCRPRSLLPSSARRPRRSPSNPVWCTPRRSRPTPRA